MKDRPKRFNVGGKVQGYIENNHIHFEGTNEAGDLMIFPWWPRLKNIEKFYKEYSIQFYELLNSLAESNLKISGYSLGGVFAIYFYLNFVQSFKSKIILEDPLRCLDKQKLKVLKKYINNGLEIIIYKKGNCIAHHWPPKLCGYKDYSGKIIEIKYKYNNFWEWLISIAKDHLKPITDEYKK